MTKTSTFDVTAFGAVGDGVTDDGPSIAAAIAASYEGSTVLFPGQHAVTAPIVMLPRRNYTGTGSLSSGPSSIVQKAGTNMTGPGGGITGLLVSRAWAANYTRCDWPLSITDLVINPNSGANPASTCCGIVLMNFDSVIEHCLIANSASHGICLTDTTADGTQQVGTSDENRIQFNRVQDTQGHGIAMISTEPGGGHGNTDGFCVDNLVSNSLLDAIHFDAAAGWLIRGNHTYGNLGCGIRVGSAEATRITENYVEAFGDVNVSGGWYQGIFCASVQGHRGVMITGNHVGCAEPSANLSYYQYIAANAAHGALSAQVVIANNVLHPNGPAGPHGTGIWIDGSGAAMSAVLSGNIIAPSISRAVRALNGAVVQQAVLETVT